MARQKRRLRPAHIAAGVLIAAVIAFANLAGRGILPQFLEKPIDQANKTTGGILYAQSAPALQDLSVRFIDVGQGDSIFVYCDGKTMLIDGGPGSANGKAESYIKSLGVTKLDYVIATHPHEDHIGGLINVLGDLPVSRLIMTGATTNTDAFSDFLSVIRQKKVPVIRAVPGSSYTLGGASFTVLAPNQTDYADLNDTSVVVRLVYHDTSFLFSGDASSDSEKDMLKKGVTLSSDVLKVGHHGSKTATTDAFLKAVHPKIAVISVGKGNIYGLPDSSTIEKLKNAGVQVLRTDENGTAAVGSDGKKLTVETEK